MIKVLFFAQTRELLDCDSLELDDDFSTVELLRLSLVSRGGKWPLVLAKDKLLVAVNQEITDFSAAIKAGDEVAFFPPVTGG